MDNLTLIQRSTCMSHIKRKNTGTELRFRKAIWKKGVRGYRIDVNLPGRPDLYFPKLELAVFIDGCFWHKCPLCYSEPKTNKDYWLPKINRNIERDLQNEVDLRKSGIQVFRYWEHDVKKNIEKITNDFLNIYLNMRELTK